MHDKTLLEEIPTTKEGCEIYRAGIIKELAKVEPVYKRLKLALKKCDDRLEKMR